MEPKSSVALIMEKNGYDPSDGLLIRRIISKNERHRIYINGKLSTISILGLITEKLASISGQHVHQSLLKEENHLLILDLFGGLISLKEKVYNYFNQLMPVVNELSRLKSLKNQKTEQIEFLKFQKSEIASVEIKPDEDKVLEQERIRLKNGEKLYKTVHKSIGGLYTSQGAVVEVLSDIIKSLRTVCTIDTELTSNTDRLSDAKFHIEDVVEELRDYLKKMSMDEKRLDEVESRLDILLKLKNKYGGSIEFILKRQQNIEKELGKIENIDDKIEMCEEKLYKLHEKLSECSLELSSKRQQAAYNLAAQMRHELDSIKMAKTKFEVVLQAVPISKKTEKYFQVNRNVLMEAGIDKVFFKIAPNIGEKLKPLANITSGGELSRLVLALKVILAQNESVGTIVFDEVDAGIGGSIAEVVGKKLASLSKFHQVICITHLPQIAKFGDHHYKVSKAIEKGRTKTSILSLNKEKRIKEIARMLGGEKITKATLAHAEEVLMTAS
eukprot:CAMPEP_0201284782 /NCGR_PEP_ID=MMETSP1317-20130820/84633_1 /ASSEMBLY_ACC=CAM_ASM_000770 /TAXON_ID=187299 /ORGANISM="Undescribed Undescribed, Strain Undescribed" /LENGTH=498 /DNA_ID=CAMNT_0047606289 /DNA_START=549 /DNA_END=2045 /DNA_ORIENTATION=-